MKNLIAAMTREKMIAAVLDNHMMPVVETKNAAYLINMGIVGISGTLLGMPIEALILGALGGAIALGRGEVMTRGKAVSTIIASMMFAGVASPAVVAFLIRRLELGTPEEELFYLQPLVPFVIGSCWQWILPIIGKKADEILRRLLDMLTGGGK